MKKVNIIPLFLAILLGFASCELVEEKTPHELLAGKWTVTSSEILTVTVPGDGSYLEFGECSSECTGIDYEAGQGTSGTFSYVMDEAGTSITINDESADGGNYNATWDILELSETSFRIVGDMGLFGSMKIEMSKTN